MKPGTQNCVTSGQRAFSVAELKLKTGPESGQALLIAVFIGLLLLMCIPVIVFVNITRSVHNVHATKRDKATGIAEEGIGYAKRALSALTAGAPAAWNNALTGDNFGLVPGCNDTTNDIIGADGGHFQLTCGSPNGGNPPPFPCPVNTVTGKSLCQPYEVYVKATAWVPDPHGTTAPNRSAPMAPTRAIEAFISQKTLAVSTPAGIEASVALRLANVPIGPGKFAVAWGPVMLTTNNLWPIYDSTISPDFKWEGMMDSDRFPRKFSSGGLTTGSFTLYNRSPQSTILPTSDQKEYWAWTSVGFPNPVDMAAYLAAARSSSCPAAITPKCVGTGMACPVDPACTVTDCCSFIVGADTATFGGPVASGAPYSLTASSNVVYVNGNARFENVALDARNGGAIIVTGNLNLGDKRISRFGLPMTNHVPITAELEYPYLPNWRTITGNPGQPAIPGTDINGASNIFGFVYVAGNLTVEPCPSTVEFPVDGTLTWCVSGAMAVDGTLTIKAWPASLAVWYSDIVNHKIKMANFELMIDSQREVPVQ